MTTKRKANHPNFEPKYSHEDKQRFFDALKETKGDLKAAAKKSGFNPQTCRYWMVKAEKKGELDEETSKIVRAWKGAVDNRLEGLLFKVIASAEKSIEKATLDQKLRAVQVITTTLKGLRAPVGRDLPPPVPGQEDAEADALAILARVEGRKGIAFEMPESESVS